MPLDIRIQDGWGTGSRACVTPRGQIIVGPLEYSQPYNVTADVANTGYNLIPPKADKVFIVTSIHLTANKNVGVGDAAIVIYEADSPTETTVVKSVFNLEMLRNSSRDLININLIVSEGKWLNVKTDDDDVFVTVLGYYAKS